MKRFYAVLAFIICALVAVQAAVAVWAESGLWLWIARGGSIDSSTMESETLPPFAEAQGFVIHGMNGVMVIPAVALVLLVVSFFAKVPKGILWAAAVVVLIVLQVVLGMAGHSVSGAGLAHGLNALLLFATALLAGRRAWVLGGTTVAGAEPAPEPTVVEPS